MGSAPTLRHAQLPFCAFSRHSAAFLRINSSRFGVGFCGAAWQSSGYAPERAVAGSSDRWPASIFSRHVGSCGRLFAGPEA
jgi:hypothetical protein